MCLFTWKFFLCKKKKIYSLKCELNNGFKLDNKKKTKRISSNIRLKNKEPRFLMLSTIVVSLVYIQLLNSNFL